MMDKAVCWIFCSYDKKVTTQTCTGPNDNLKRIYDILKTQQQNFKKRKSVVHKGETKETKTPEKQLLLSG
nr:hypothetical protein [Cytophagales bacterium]